MNVGFRLVVVVIADEKFHGIVGKEGAELLPELTGQGFVVRQNERRSLRLLDDLRHGKGFAGACYAEQSLSLVAVFQAFTEFGDGLGLIACGLHVLTDLKPSDLFQEIL